MRNQLNKLNKGTKAEKRIGEILKRNQIEFLFHPRIGRYQPDFLCDKVIIEVDGSIHKKIDSSRDSYFFSQGLIPLHISAYPSNLHNVEKEIVYLIKENNATRRIKR